MHLPYVKGLYGHFTTHLLILYKNTYQNFDNYGGLQNVNINKHVWARNHLSIYRSVGKSDRSIYLFRRQQNPANIQILNNK